MKLEIQEFIEGLIKEHDLETIEDLALSVGEGAIFTGCYEFFSGIEAVGVEDIANPNNLSLVILSNEGFPSIYAYADEQGIWFSRNQEELMHVPWLRQNTHWLDKYDCKFACIDITNAHAQRWRLHKNKLANYIDLARSSGLFHMTASEAL